MRMFRIVLGLSLAYVMLVGCGPRRQSSTVNTYEREGPPAEERQQSQQGEERTTGQGEWRMAEPGQMVVEP